jgi:hypothetical protein
VTVSELSSRARFAMVSNACFFCRPGFRAQHAHDTLHVPAGEWRHRARSWLRVGQAQGACVAMSDRHGVCMGRMGCALHGRLCVCMPVGLWACLWCCIAGCQAEHGMGGACRSRQQGLARE